MQVVEAIKVHYWELYIKVKSWFITFKYKLKKRTDQYKAIAEKRFSV